MERGGGARLEKIGDKSISNIGHSTPDILDLAHSQFEDVNLCKFYHLIKRRGAR